MSQRSKLTALFNFPEADEDCRFTRSPIITIYVGPEREIFTVHQDLLCYRSDYFKTLLKEQWKEGQTKELIWDEPDDKIEYVETMMDWLYGQKLDIDKLTSEHLLFCYKFAEKRLMSGWKNSLMDALRAKHKKEKLYFGPAFVKEAKDLDLMHTPLYTYIVRSFVVGMVNNRDLYKKAGECDADMRDYITGPDIGVDIIQEMLSFAQKPPQDPSIPDGCHYHDHTDGSSCSTKGK